MMNSVFRMILLFTVLLLATACGSEASAEPTPPEIYYGEDVCEFCGMIVSEERFAAGYVTEAGQEYVFDDIADMVQSHLKQQRDVAAFFVHDYNEHTWIRAETAHYVQSPDLTTPMLSGLAAFSSAEEAKQFAERLSGDIIMSFEELQTYYQENPSAPMSNMN